MWDFEDVLLLARLEEVALLWANVWGECKLTVLRPKRSKTRDHPEPSHPEEHENRNKQ